MKNVLYQLHSIPVHRGSNSFGMPRGAQMSLDLQWTEIGYLSFKCKHYLQACTTKWKETIDFVRKRINGNS